MEQTESKIEYGKNWYDKSYKFIALIPVIFLILCLVYLASFNSNNGGFFIKDVSLSGGTVITLTGNVDLPSIEEGLKEQGIDFNTRKLTDLTSGEQLAVIVESSVEPESLKSSLEDILGYGLTEDNSSIEFTGSTMSNNFYKQLILALLMSFVLMSLVIIIMFRSIIPSFSVIFAAFSNIVIPLAIVDFFGIRISAAGIAAFLMIIGYSVDTNILLTTRALKKTELEVNQRIFSAFKTGIFMSAVALLAVIPAFFIVTGLPDSFRQIFLILGLGLTADIFNTWFTNAGIIKWYVEKKEQNSQQGAAQ